MTVLFFTILLAVIMIYFVNYKSDIEAFQSQQKAFQYKIEGKINDILRRLHALENAQIIQKSTITPEQSKQTEQTPNANNIESQEVQDLTAYAQAIQDMAEIAPHHPHIEKVSPAAAHVSKSEDKENIESGSFDLEKLFLGNVFSKIGGIALVIAICFLIKLTSNYIEFTPVMKISMGYLVSIGILFYSLYLYQKETKVTSEILSGVSIAGLLLSTYFACFMYELFTIPIALIIAFIIALTSYFISQKYHSFSTIAIGLFGGYLNPAVLNDSVSLGVLFGYLIALNFISVAYTFKNGSKNVINCINIALTIITLIIFSSKGTVSIVYPILLWLLYVVYDIITTVKKSIQSDSKLLRWINFGALLFITNHIFHYTDKIAIGSTIVVVGIVYGVLYYIFKNKNEDIQMTNLQSGLICLLVSTFYLVNNPYLGLAWAVEGFLISELYLKLNKPFLRSYVFGFFLPSFIYLFLNFKEMFIMEDVNILLVTFAIYLCESIIMLYSAKRLEKQDRFCSNNLIMLGWSVMYLYAIFFLNCGKSDMWTKFYINTIIACIYSLHSYKLLKSDYREFALTFSQVLYGLAIILLCFAEGLAVNQTNYIAFFNLEFLSYLTIIALTIYYHLKLSNIYGYIAVILGLFSLIGQLNCLFGEIFPTDTMPLVITISLMIYSGVILTIGILKNIGFMKQTSICLILILLTKLIFIDLYNIDAVFKLIAFVIIGVILLGVSYYYQKLKK